MVHIVWLPLVQLAQFKEHKMKKLLFVLVTVLFLIGPADAQWGSNDPRWFEDDATKISDNVWSAPIELVVNFATDGWNEATPHQLFAGTGDVEFEITAHCSTNVASTSADSIHIFAGESAKLLSMLSTNIDAGEAIFPPNFELTYGVGTPKFDPIWQQGKIWRGELHMGQDIDYDIDEEAFTGGIIIFTCRYRAITTGGSIAAGDGT